MCYSRYLQQYKCNVHLELYRCASECVSSNVNHVELFFFCGEKKKDGANMTTERGRLGRRRRRVVVSVTYGARLFIIIILPTTDTVWVRTSFIRTLVDRPRTRI